MWFLTVRSLFVTCLLLMLRITVASTDGSEQTDNRLSVDNPVGGRLFDYQKQMFLSPSNVYKNQRRERQIQLTTANDDSSAVQSDFYLPESRPNRATQPKIGGGQNCYFSPIQCRLYATPMHGIGNRLRVGRADGHEVRRVNPQDLSGKRQTNRNKYALLQRWRTEGLASSGLRM
ncbi:hypothetical protein M3Y98_00237600 [Aphelenchoides besseyi]|nr:hypothetical protein M3Y98_00237600 [Aphelenchoides besseyi]KAI6200646.1 hypothetical protein M3Y96_00755900 [Aphelenchoides besseyi]